MNFVRGRTVASFRTVGKFPPRGGAPCGKPRADAFEWALRANMKISLGALALTRDGGEERLVLTNCFLARTATPSLIKASVKELAHYGDWIESKLGGLDDF